MKPIIFSGTGNRELGKEIATSLKTSLAKVEIIRFADSECRVRIEEDVSGKDVFVIQSLSNPVDENLMEFLLICDALKREEVRRITAILPYIGYARQDRKHRSGECISASVVAKLIEAVHVDKVITANLHSEAVNGFFKIPVVDINGLSLFYGLVRDPQDVVIVSPDAGGMKRSQRFAEEVDAPLAFIKKKRDLATPHKILSMNVVGDVAGKTAIIVDDVIVSGGTLVNAAHLLKQMGATKVIAIATHANLVGGSDKILEVSPIDEVWLTDSISVSPDKRFKKLQIISIVSLLAKELKKAIR